MLELLQNDVAVPAAALPPTCRFGVYVNNRAAIFLGETFSLDNLLALSTDAEAAGVDFVSVGDSMLAKPRYSPIPVLSAIAARTTSLGLTTGILQPHLRNVVWLAQEWATLDALAHGRTSIAVGLGTGPRDLVAAELALVGLNHRRRARAFEESIIALRRLWLEDTVDFDGSTIQLHGVSVPVKPVREPCPPIVIACGAFVADRPGSGPNDVFRPDLANTFIGPFERVARLGDGWVTGMATPTEWGQGWRQIVAAAERAGRDITGPAFERRINTFLRVDESPTCRRDGKEFLEQYHRLPMDDLAIDRWLIHGSPAQCIERINEFVEAGANSFQFVLASSDQRGQLQRLAEDLLPALRPVTV